MKEIFKDDNQNEFIDLKNEYIESNISFNKDSFIYRLYVIDSILESNLDFINKVLKIRDNSKTLKQYDEEYINFIRTYYFIVRNFISRMKEIINKHYFKPSFMLDLGIYYDDISNKILHEIVYEKGNLQLLGTKLNILFKDKKRYADELYAMYCNYINSINSIRKEIKFQYSRNLR